jgi:hypothetical protein
MKTAADRHEVSAIKKGQRNIGRGDAFSALNRAIVDRNEFITMKEGWRK